METAEFRILPTSPSYGKRKLVDARHEKGDFISGFIFATNAKHAYLQDKRRWFQARHLKPINQAAEVVYARATGALQ